jgi:hypothetical protein
MGQATVVQGGIVAWPLPSEDGTLGETKTRFLSEGQWSKVGVVKSIKLDG